MNRKFLLYTIIILTGLVYIGKLFFLQVYQHSFSNSPLNNAAIKTKYEYPDRGYIYDRNGILLVANQLSYDIMVIPREVKALDTVEFCSLLDIDKKSFLKRLQKARHYSPRIPSRFLQQLSKDDYAYLQEKMHKFKGFFIQKRSIRQYPIKSAANVLGYISEVNEGYLRKNKYYHQGELIGTLGVEKTYEKILRGTKGKSYIQRNRFNKEIGSYKDGIYDTLAKTGKDLTLTIDSNLQQYGELLMQNKRGGIIALEPATGEILAMISAPTYDPNLMVGRGRSKNSVLLFGDTINRPMYDRSLQAMYPPGSPFKIVSALVALQEGVITPESSVKCYHGYRYGTRSKAFMKCHCGMVGIPVRLNEAMYRSCNTYFSTAYRKSIEKYDTPSEGMDAWNKHVTSFGLGKYFGNDLSVGQPGLIPNANYYKKYYPNGGWRAVTTISNAIGQGEILTTPLQLANLTATVANRGFYITPHIVKKIKDMEVDRKFITKNITTIDKKHFGPVIEGLFNVFEKPNGTARGSRVAGIEISGKTGTAENYKKINGVRTKLTDHSIFIAFAPKDNPKIAIAVFVENGYWGSRWGGPIASLMIEKYLKGSTSRPALERRMVQGSLQEEYKKQLSIKQVEK
ncbi:MAG: penicillin-binding protein 2 [Flavobacteriaceae bacterium]|nr:MAG: penicillin-binding protein 2 [Flavobacteriaceae bacterium]